MTARTDRKLALIAGAVLAVIFIVCSATQVASWSLGSVHRDSVDKIPGPVRELHIQAGAGDIEVVPGLGPGVVIDSHTSGAVHVPKLRTSYDGSSVTVSGGCAAMTFGHCSARIVFAVPPTASVEIDAGSGDVSISGITGGVDVRASSGDVVAEGLSGTVSLESASGDVFARDLRAPIVHAQTASGDVDLAFAAAPQSADASTSSGDASILVPRGPEGYRVSVDTHSGDHSVGVREDDTSTRMLRARTNSGDATVGYAG